MKNDYTKMWLGLLALALGAHGVHIDLFNETVRSNFYYPDIVHPWDGREIQGYGVTGGSTIELDLTVRLTSPPVADSEFNVLYPLRLGVLLLDTDTHTENQDYGRTTPATFEGPGCTEQSCWSFIPSTRNWQVELEQDGETEFKRTSTIPFTGRYSVAIWNPQRLELSLKGTLSMIEPWGHLAVGHRYMPHIFLISTIIYIVLSIAWCIYYYQHKNRAVGVHRVLTVTIALRVLSTGAYCIHFYQFNSSGTAWQGAQIAVGLVADAFEIAGMLFMMMVASGWGIVRMTISKKIFKTAIASIVTYALICVLERFCYILPKFCYFVFLMRLICRSFLLVGIIAMLNALISATRSNLQTMPWNRETQLKYDQYWMYQVIRYAFLPYILVPVIMFVAQVTAFSWQQEWVEHAVSTTISSPIFEVLIVYYFRPSAHCHMIEGRED